MKVFGASTDSNRKHCAKFYDDPMSFNVITLRNLRFSQSMLVTAVCLQILSLN